MRPLRTLLLLALPLAACRPGEPGGTVPPPGLPTGAEPAVRVGIVVDSAGALIGGGTGITVGSPTGDVAFEIPAGEAWEAHLDGERVSLRSPDGTVTEALRVPVRLRAARGDRVRVNGREYRGDLLLRSGPKGGLTVVNTLDLEAYLLGVVPHEMGRLGPELIEALKVQAVAARTYAVGNMGGREALGFDFHATVSDQVYGGTASEDSVVSRAVRETRGEIVTYGGAPILAYYSSTCGGRTAAIEESWPQRAPLPYLRSVSDEKPDGGHWCDFSSRWEWTTTWTRPELLATLGRTLATYAGERVAQVAAEEGPRAVDVLARSRSLRATVRLDVDGRHVVVRADSVRRVLTTPAGGLLNSSRLYAVNRTPEGGLEVRGGGWGHAIGMCQVGAMGRARAGHGYRAILTAYYTDTDVTRLY